MTFVPHDAIAEHRADGTILLRSRTPIGPIARTTGDWLEHWAGAAPDRVAFAERAGVGWRTITYAELLGQVRTVAAALLGRDLGPDRPILIISGNGIEHAVLTLAGQYVGILTVAVAEQYALVPQARPRLVHAVETIRPALVFAADAALYGPALAMPELAGVEKIVVRDADTAGATPWSSLLAGGDAAAVDPAHAAVGPDTVAKIIFTSGSTATPKGVVTTHRMLCVNQAQIAAVNPMLGERPHRIVEWLPWNHVFGGSNDFNMMLAGGGTFYIDDGKPTRAGIARTIENIKLARPTLAFNVPIAFAQLVDAMRTDDDLKQAYLGECDLIFYAAASLPRDLWDALRQFAAEVRGAPPPMYSGWGMSETAPSSLQSHQPVDRPGNIGVPLPLVAAKLVPDIDGRY